MKLVLLGLILVIVFVAAVRYMEKSSIFFPMKEIATDPTFINLSYEDVYFNVSDGNRLNGWFIPADGGKKTIIFCHGNAGNISHRLEKLEILHSLGANVFIFDYRGYGRSSGRPSEKGLYADLEAAYDYAVETLKTPPEKIVLYGESLGGAVAVDLAARREAGAVITEDVFTSVRDMAVMAYPFLPPFIFSSKFDSVSKIKKVRCAKLIIHSVDDEIVPFRMGQRLFDAAPPPREFLQIRGGHNTAFLDSRREYTEGLKNFLEKP